MRISALILLAFTASAFTPAPALSENTVTVEELGKLHGYRKYEGMGRSYQTQTLRGGVPHFTYLFEESQRQYTLYHDGKKVGPAYGIVKTKFRISPDGKRAAYSAGPKKGTYYYLTSDQKYGPFEATYVREMGFLADGRFVYPYKKNGKWHVAVNGKEGPPMISWVNAKRYNKWTYRLVISNNRYAYRAHLGEGKFAVVTDGKMGKIYADVSIPHFSPDSRHIHYTARLATGKEVSVTDGRETPLIRESSGIKANHATSPDGKRSAHLLFLGDFIQGAKQAVVDGVKGPEFASLRPFAFSPDSKHLAYGAQLDNGNWVMVRDGKWDKEYEGFPYGRKGIKPLFSPDSWHLVFLAEKGDRKRVVLDVKEEDHLWDEIATKELVFSPDSKRFAYHGIKGNWKTGAHHIIVDGKAGPAYDQVTRVTFSADSKHYAYGGKKEGKWRLVRNGKEAADLWDNLRTVVFAGNKLFSQVSDGPWGKLSNIVGDSIEPGKKYMIIDGVKSQKFRFAHGITFGPEKKHLYYFLNFRKGAKPGKVMFKNETALTPLYYKIGTEARRGSRVWKRKTFYFNLNPNIVTHGMIKMRPFIFSPDGKRMAFFAMKQRGGNYQLFIKETGDGSPEAEEGPAFYLVGKEPIFDGNDTIRYLAVKNDGMLVRVTHRLEPLD